MRKASLTTLPAALFAAALAWPTPTGAEAPAAAENLMVAQAGTEAAGKGEKALSAQDRKFVDEATMGGLMEVQLGELAAKNAASDDVRQFGQRMAADHGKANEKLKSIAQAQGASLPQELDQKHQKDVNRLQKLSGEEFDRTYMALMVEDHEKDVRAFRKQAEQGDNPELKQFAADTLPTLEQHLEMARDLSKRTR